MKDKAWPVGITIFLFCFVMFFMWVIYFSQKNGPIILEREPEKTVSMYDGVYEENYFLIKNKASRA